MQISELYKIYRQFPKVNTDTRKDLSGSIFFCLKGPNFDANTFADTALTKGAAHVVTDAKDNLGKENMTYVPDVLQATALTKGAAHVVTDAEDNRGKENMTYVPDVLQALQELAAMHRSNFTFPVIGLTGSNGKTTNKELIAAVLGTKYKTYFTKGNLNNHIGVPITLLETPLDAEMAVVEMGANHLGEIRDLCNISYPDYGLITNIGKAHLEGFGGMEGVIKGKKEIFDHIEKNGGKVFVNGDDPIISDLSKNMDRILYGKNASDYFVNGEIVTSTPFISFSYSRKGYTSPEIKTRLVGGYNFYNLMAAVCIGLYFDVSDNDIAKSLASYVPTNNRSQLLQTSKNKIILDAYNANPSSMDAAVENLQAQKADLKYALLGEMRELGITGPEEHQILIDKLKSFGLNAMLVGEGYKLCDKKDFHWFENSIDLMEYLKNNPIDNALILLKGSRAVAMERVVEVL